MEHTAGNMTGSRPTRNRSDRKEKRNSVLKRPDLRAILKPLQLADAYLICANNPGSTRHEREVLDESISKIALIHSILAYRTESGKEISALKDIVGFPPFTFSKVFPYFPGSAISLAQTWEEEGMETLLPFSITPPADPTDKDRRQAVLYGIGDLDELADLEQIFVEYFQPTEFAACLTSSEDLPSQLSDVTHFFVQWELSDQEAATALGYSVDSPEFNEIMAILHRRSQDKEQPIKRKEVRDWSGIPLLAPAIQS